MHFYNSIKFAFAMAVASTTSFAAQSASATKDSEKQMLFVRCKNDVKGKVSDVLIKDTIAGAGVGAAVGLAGGVTTVLTAGGGTIIGFIMGVEALKEDMQDCHEILRFDAKKLKSDQRYSNAVVSRINEAVANEQGLSTKPLVTSSSLLKAVESKKAAAPASRTKVPASDASAAH